MKQFKGSFPQYFLDEEMSIFLDVYLYFFRNMEASMKKSSQPSPIPGALEKSMHRIYISLPELSSYLLLGIQGPSEGEH